MTEKEKAEWTARFVAAGYMAVDAAAAVKGLEIMRDNDWSWHVIQDDGGYDDLKPGETWGTLILADDSDAVVDALGGMGPYEVSDHGNILWSPEQELYLKYTAAEMALSAANAPSN